MAPVPRSQKSSAPASQTSKNLPIQKKKDVEKDTEISELKKIIEAQELEIENLKKENQERLERDSKKIEAAKKIIDSQKKQIEEQVVDRTGIEDIKKENEEMKEEIAELKRNRPAPVQLPAPVFLPVRLPRPVQVPVIPPPRRPRAAHAPVVPPVPQPDQLAQLEPLRNQVRVEGAYIVNFLNLLGNLRQNPDE